MTWLTKEIIFTSNTTRIDMKKRFDLVIIAFLLIIIAFFVWRDYIKPGGTPPGGSDTVRTSDTIPGDSVPYEVQVTVPVPVYRDTGSTRWRDRPIDTPAILADYFSRNFYSDTITDDTSFLAIIQDTVTRNRIAWRRYQHQNLRPTAINTTTVINYYGKGFYPGLGAGLTPDKPAVMLHALFIRDKKWSYCFTIDVNNKACSATLFYRLARDGP